MNLFRSISVRVFIVLILLSSWMGVYHHDAWLALSGAAHHHPSHSVGKHTDKHHGHDVQGHHYGHFHHDPDTEQKSDDEGSIPLPDSHKDLIATHLGHKEILSRSVQTFDTDALFDLFQITDLFSEPVLSIGKPPPDHDRANRPAFHIDLKDCVQSNAPPVLS